MSSLGASARSLANRAKAVALQQDWSRMERRGEIDRRLPHPSINYNQTGDTRFRDYRTAFVSDALLRELPGLMALAAPGVEDGLRLLDYGCGLGRLAFAFSELFGADPRYRYVGHEVHPAAYEFLCDAYRDYDNISFITDRLEIRDSYIEIEQSDGAQPAGASQEGIAATEVQLLGRVEPDLDVQYSHSVFTHMYREPITTVLTEVAKVLGPTGVSVNTWLLVDRAAETAMRLGLADRQLPYEFDGFLSYSQDNPLACSAYRLDVVEEIYRSAGHTIVDIQHGSWSGRVPSQHMTYQDVVVSAPAK